MKDLLLGFGLLFPLFMVAVVFHEVSHGWVARFFGDTTAQEAGRLTLNPLRHMDPMGTLILPIFLILAHSPFVFGWAKPVPINPLSLRNPKRDMIWVAVAGPVVNFVMAILGTGLIRVGGGFFPPLVVGLLKTFVLINVVLGVFNLFPLPPLDGSRVLAGLLPVGLARWFLAVEPWGMWIVVFLLAVGWIDRLLWPMVGFFTRLLGL